MELFRHSQQINPSGGSRNSGGNQTGEFDSDDLESESSSSNLNENTHKHMIIFRTAPAPREEAQVGAVRSRSNSWDWQPRMKDDSIGVAARLAQSADRMRIGQLLEIERSRLRLSGLS